MNIFHCRPTLWTLVKLGLLYFLVTFELITFRSQRQSLFKVQVKTKASIPSQEPYIYCGLIHDGHIFIRHIANIFILIFLDKGNY